MKILVTGATGYIGEAVATVLQEQGHDLSGLTRDTTSSRAQALSDSGIRMFTGDVEDPATYREHLGAVDAIVHTASHGDRPDADRGLFEELRALQAVGTAPHLLYTTGCSVYGAHSHSVLTEKMPADPGHPRFILEEELRSSGLRHTTVRPAFVYGRDNRSSLLGRWLAEAQAGQGAFYGDSTKVWSWVHVDDLARAYALIVGDLLNLHGETFLIADEHPEPAVETYAAAQRRHGRIDPVIFAPIDSEDALYRVFDRDEVVDAQKARRRLAWSARAGTVSDSLA